MEEKKQKLEEQLETVVKDKLADSVTLRGAIINQLISINSLFSINLTSANDKIGFVQIHITAFILGV